LGSEEEEKEKEEEHGGVEVTRRSRVTLGMVKKWVESLEEVSVARDEYCKSLDDFCCSKQTSRNCVRDFCVLHKSTI